MGNAFFPYGKMLWFLLVWKLHFPWIRKFNIFNKSIYHTGYDNILNDYSPVPYRDWNWSCNQSTPISATLWSMFHYRRVDCFSSFQWKDILPFYPCLGWLTLNPIFFIDYINCCHFIMHWISFLMGWGGIWETKFLFTSHCDIVDYF